MVLETAHKWAQVRIHEKGEIPTDLYGFKDVSTSLVLAYPNELSLGIPEGLTEDAREVAVTRVAYKFRLTKDEALEKFDICIVPTQVKGQGRVMAKLKKLQCV